MPLASQHNTRTAICMEQLGKHYSMGGEIIHALDDINFHVEQGEFVAIIGPSGSGKSTLMNIIGLLDIPDEGTYMLAGQDVALLSDNELADVRNRTIGFVFQSFNLLSTLTALENVKLPLTYRGTRPKEANKIARHYLEKVGLAGREAHMPHQLSGGQQQRVAIARALAGQPEIVLADEPTGALDSHTSIEIMQLFKELNHEGQTVIFITHNPDLANQAHRVVHLIDGKLGSASHTALPNTRERSAYETHANG